MSKKHFSGIMVPITTPYDAQGAFAPEDLKKHLEAILKAGTQAILVPSGTGEFANLTFEQRVEITRTVARQVNKRAKIVSLISDCSTEHVLQLAKLVKDAGADEVMLTPPYYSHINQKAIYEFFKEVATNIDMPLWIYHQPGETKLTVEPETVVELAKIPNIVGIKAAAAEDFLYLTRLLNLMEDNESFSILNGEDFCLYPSLALGGDGGVSSLGNVIPNEFVKLHAAVMKGDHATAKKMHDMIIECFKMCVMVDSGAYQSAVKTVLVAQGFYSTNRVKSPFITIDEEEQKKVLTRAKELKLI